jgi:acetyl-CoA acetyltransferase
MGDQLRRDAFQPPDAHQKHQRINALRQRGAKRGVASLCIGGGEATAIAIEII